MRANRFLVTSRSYSLGHFPAKNLLLRCVVIVALLGWGPVAAFAEAPQAPTLFYSTDGVNLTASWTSSPEAAGYKLYYAPYPYTGPNSVGNIDVGNSTIFDYPLWDGAAYYIAVKAYNDNQEMSGYSNIENFRISLPRAPDAPQLSYALDGTSISMNWSPIPNATGYLLNYTASAFTGPESFMIKDLGNNTSFSYMSLSAGGTYTLALQAYNEFGTSGYSNTETFTVPIPQSTGIVGHWNMALTTGVNNCGDPLGVVYMESLAIEDTGRYTAFGTTLNGNISGNSLYWSGSYSFYEQGGLTTKTELALTASTDGTTLEGAVSWTWTDGSFTCSGTDSIFATRAY